MPTKTATKKTAAKKRPAPKKAPEAVFSSAPDGAAPAAPKTAKKRPAAKKASTKAPATKSTENKAPATKSATKVAKKKPAAKKSAAVGGQALPRDLNVHGFVVGSDSAKIAEVLLAGGASRADINDLVEKALGKNKKTRNGNSPNVSSLIANVLRRLKDKGYYVEETWILKEPTPATKAKATKAAKAREAAASDGGDTPAASTAKKRPAAKKPSTTGAKKRPASKPATKVAKKRPAPKAKG